jgi:hypothetical protein
MSEKTFSVRLPVQSRVALETAQKFYFQRYGLDGVLLPLAIKQGQGEGCTDVGIFFGNRVLVIAHVVTEEGGIYNHHHVVEFYDSDHEGWFRPVIGPDGETHYAPANIVLSKYL